MKGGESQCCLTLHSGSCAANLNQSQKNSMKGGVKYDDVSLVRSVLPASLVLRGRDIFGNREVIVMFMFVSPPLGSRRWEFPWIVY